MATGTTDPTRQQRGVVIASTVQRRQAGKAGQAGAWLDQQHGDRHSGH